MDSDSISIGGDDESGAGIEDSSTAIETNVLAVDKYVIKSAFPETLRIHIINRRQRVLLEFGRIETSESDFSIIAAISDATKPVRGDRILDETSFRERFDWCKDTLLRKSL